MSSRCWWVTALLGIGVFSWQMYEDHLLWEAARSYYIAPLLKLPERMQELVDVCEQEVKGEDSSSARSGWQRKWPIDRPALKRGGNVSPNIGLEWQRKYRFTNVISIADVHPDGFHHVLAVCEYNPERKTAYVKGQ